MIDLTPHSRSVGNYGSIDIVIPFTAIHPLDNIELNLCLQTIKRFMSGYRNIYIVGDKPSFEGDYIHLPETDRGRGKQDNIRIKIETACGHPDITDSFLFMNNDYFLIKPMDARTVMAAYNKPLINAYHDKRKIGSYKQALQNTVDSLGPSVNHFDIHYPVKYNKGLFVGAMCNFPWKRWDKRDGYVIKTLYCNYVYQLSSFRLDDPKLKESCTSVGQLHEIVKDWPMFSTDENSFNEVVIEYLAGVLKQTADNPNPAD
jgi:hypothetical protein